MRGDRRTLFFGVARLRPKSSGLGRCLGEPENSAARGSYCTVGHRDRDGDRTLRLISFNIPSIPKYGLTKSWGKILANPLGRKPTSPAAVIKSQVNILR